MSISAKKLPKIIQIVQIQLQNKPEILFAMLYGSAAMGEDFNDIDVALFVDRNKVTSTDELNYTISLSNQLEKKLSCPIDIRVINNAPLGFKYNVSTGTPLIINDENSLHSLLEHTWDMYLDYKPVAMRYFKEMQ